MILRVGIPKKKPFLFPDERDQPAELPLDLGQLPRDLGDQQGRLHPSLPEAQSAGVLIRRRHRQVCSPQTPSKTTKLLQSGTKPEGCGPSDQGTHFGGQNFELYNPRYTEVANNVQTQETILNIQFVLLDCAPLKFSILSHCQEWQNKFTSLLRDIATAKLTELHEFLSQNAAK